MSINIRNHRNPIAKLEYLNHDGVFIEETQVTSTLLHSATRIMFGAVDKSTSSPDAFYEGAIDDIYIHRRVLEDWEITNLFQMK